MKKIYGFAFASAAMMLASCSSDEPINNGNQPLENDGYLALTIATNGNGTRAGVSNDFADGSSDENEAKNATVLLFDAAGNQTQAPVNVTLGEWTNSTVEGVKQETTLTVEKSGSVPTQIMVILNAPATANYTGKNLTAMKAEAADYATTGAAGTFVMSNAQYNGGDGAATAVPQNAIQPTMDLAKDNAVTVYVERVNARLDVAEKAGLQAELPEITMQDGSTKQLSLKIEGIGVAYSAA